MNGIRFEELKQAFDDVFYAYKSIEIADKHIEDKRILIGDDIVNLKELVMKYNGFRNELVSQFKEALIHADNLISRQILEIDEYYWR